MKNFEMIGRQASRLALGCMRMHQLEESAVDAVLTAALESGINFFDHADIYGRGDSERSFGAAVKRLGIKRESLIIQSKCGIDQGMYNFNPDYILRSVDGILKRLDTDYLDLLLLHRPDTLMEPEAVGETFAALKRSGKVRGFGVSNMNPYQIELLQSALEEPLLVNQLQFSLLHTPLLDEGFHVNLNREAGVMRSGGTLEYCRLHKIRIQTWSPLQFGFIEGAFVDHADYPKLNEALAEAAAKYDSSKAAVALAWILRHPAGMQVLLGSMSPERIRSAAKAVEIELTRREWYDLYSAAGRRLP